MCHRQGAAVPVWVGGMAFRLFFAPQKRFSLLFSRNSEPDNRICFL